MGTDNIALALQLLMGLTQRAVELTTAIESARSQGRDLTDEELNAMFAADVDARAALQAEIDKRRGG